MPVTSKSTRTLNSLQEEIRQLRQKAKQLEEKIDDNFIYFQEHSGSLFIRSLLPHKIEGETLTGSKLLDTFLQNDRLQKILIRLADRLAGRVGDGINWLVTRVFKK